MNFAGIIVYVLGAVVVYLMALDMLNVRRSQRRPTAAAIAAVWPPLLIVALIFLAADVIEIAWRRSSLPHHGDDRT
ncbi:hypothetical protein IT881_15145 [Erythrobacter sp. A30-3]|jgi:NADH:ubiquinone oxidoreductase subunit 6 (subunit J)|nr:hypothetical protein IT881_15145 [Erythrobacter sp. A30-3]